MQHLIPYSASFSVLVYTNCLFGNAIAMKLCSSDVLSQENTMNKWVSESSGA